MPKNRKLQNVIGTEHIKDAAEAEIAAQASGGATVAFKNVAVSGQDNIVADASADTLNIAGAGSVSVTTNAANDTLTITGTDTNTQLSTEQVQDIVGAMFTGNTETGITATYEDSDGTIDLVASGGSPGGSNHQIQFNNGGSFGGDANFTFDDTADAEKVVLEATSSETLLRITQNGEGHALVVEDETNPDNSPFVINKFGRVGIGENAVNNSYSLSTGASGNIRFGTNGFITGGRFLASQNQAPSNPVISRLTDIDTGLYFPGADQIGFSTGGTERLRFGSAGQIGIAGANYGTSGQVLTSGGASGAVSWTTVSGGSAFAPTPQVFRQGSGGSTNPRTTLTALTPYGFPSFSNTNHPTTLQRVFFFPFIAPETVAITKLSVYVSSANASSPNVLLGIYTATEAGSGTTLQRTPNALQMTASVATTSTGYQDATVSAYSGGSTTITEGTLYYAAYARAAATAGGSQLQGVQSASRSQISVSIGNANQVAINNGSGQGGEHSDGDALAASYPSAYPSSKTTSTTTLHIMYRVD